MQTERDRGAEARWTVCACLCFLQVMGASGSGKTTLLSILSGRHASSTSRLSSGSILFNARAVPYDSLSRASAFVQQSDLLLSHLTVSEIITFAAVMKLPKDMALADKQARVRRIIRELGLDKCADVCVGSSGAGDGEADGGGKASGGARQGISGGQQRRVQIGTELITEPRLVFLDEPSQCSAHEQRTVDGAAAPSSPRSRLLAHVVCVCGEPLGSTPRPRSRSLLC